MVRTRGLHQSLFRTRDVASSAGAAWCSLTFFLDYGSLITVGLGALVVLSVGPEHIANRGCWLDYQWRLQLIARSLLT